MREEALDLSGYKEKIPPVNKGALAWEKELIFTAEHSGVKR